jgi:hypothetical protein
MDHGADPHQRGQHRQRDRDGAAADASIRPHAYIIVDRDNDVGRASVKATGDFGGVQGERIQRPGGEHASA